MTSQIELLTIADIKALKDPEWLIQGIMQVRGFVELYGPPKNGKSFIGLDWALSIAAGIQWLGHKVTQGCVVYIYAESPSGLKFRVPAWSAAHGGTEPGEFYAFPGRLDVTSGKDRADFIKLIEDRGCEPAMIVIDTVQKCFGVGDENSTSDMGKFIDGCEKLRAHFDSAILIVHHTGVAQKGSRGSSALPGAVDAQFKVTMLANKKIRMVHEAQRDGTDHPDMWLALAPSCNSVVVVSSSRTGAAEGVGAPKNRDKVIAALAQFMPGGATLDQWKAAALASEETVARTFNRVKRGLIDGDEVEELGGSWFLKGAGDGQDTAGTA